MLDHSCQVQRAPLSERADDFYQTPTAAVEALLRVEHLPRLIWEPAAGRNAIVDVLRCAGRDVIATDLVDYGVGNESRIDFLFTRSAPPDVYTIVTNPPYKLAEDFVRHALTLVPTVIMLLRLAFLEGEGRSDILDGAGLARIYVFRKRLPMMHRAGWQGRKGNSGMAFAWFVWERWHARAPIIRRISWEDNRDSRRA